MAKALKIRAVSLPIGTIFPVNFADNVRDPSGTTYDVSGLKAEILLDGGVKVRPLVLFRNGQYAHPIQGFRRITAVGELHAEHPEDRRWDTVACEMVEDLSDAEVMRLMLDHGNTKNLERHEVVNAAWKVLDADNTTTDQELAVRLRGLLEIHFKPAGSNNPDEIGAHFRGIIQNMRNMWRLPTMCHPLMMALVKKRGAVSYRKKDIAALVKIFESEKKADLTGTITKQNPGAAFNAKWDEFVSSEEEKEQGGETRKKAIASMSKAELDAAADNSISSVFKQIVKLVTRTIPDPDRKLALYTDTFAKEVESKIPEETRKLLVTILDGSHPALKVEAPELAAV